MDGRSAGIVASFHFDYVTRLALFETFLNLYGQNMLFCYKNIFFNTAPLETRACVLDPRLLAAVHPLLLLTVESTVIL